MLCNNKKGLLMLIQTVSLVWIDKSYDCFTYIFGQVLIKLYPSE